MAERSFNLVVPLAHEATAMRNEETDRQRAGRSSADVYEMANSYFGLLRQASSSHQDRARFAKVLLRRGHAVDHALTKTFRRRPS